MADKELWIGPKVVTYDDTQTVYPDDPAMTMRGIRVGGKMCVEEAPDDDSDVVRKVDLTGGAVFPDMQPYQVRDGVGNQSITGTRITVNMDTVSVANAAFSLASDEITFNNDGIYYINFAVSADDTDTAGGARAELEASVELDPLGVGSYAVIQESICSAYLREVGGVTTAGKGFLVDINATDKIRVRARRLVGSTNMDTTAGQSSIMIIKVGNS
jgi:hypothetical protein